MPSSSIHIKQQFKISASLKLLAYTLTGIGVLSFLIGLTTKTGTEEEKAVFIGTIMYNVFYWTFVANAAMFFICIITLAKGGWYQSFRRIPEAISTLVPVFGIITIIVLLYVVLSGNHHIYYWLNTKFVANDNSLKEKSPFLNIKFFIIWTVLSIGLWSLSGWKMRQLSNTADAEKMNVKTAKKYIFKNTVYASLFIIWFALTVGSTIPWLWMMSLDAGWYSTIYSWYVFSSSFVAGISLIALWVVYLKKQGYLEFTNENHLHDLGIFIFAFSIFWAYLWFSQYMIIWYANIPEETIYFKHRVEGAYKGFFFINIIINFIAPVLILMSRNSKRKYGVVAFAAVLLLLGHWIDFYLMVMGSISKDKITFGWLDAGVLCFFAGIIISGTARALASKPLVPVYHPLLKESIIHHT